MIQRGVKCLLKPVDLQLRFLDKKLHRRYERTSIEREIVKTKRKNVSAKSSDRIGQILLQIEISQLEEVLLVILPQCKERTMQSATFPF